MADGNPAQKANPKPQTAAPSAAKPAQPKLSVVPGGGAAAKPAVAPAQPAKPSPAPTAQAKPAVAPAQPAKPSPAPTAQAKPAVAPAQPAKPNPAPTAQAKPAVAPAQPAKPNPAPTAQAKPAVAPAQPAKPNPATVASKPGPVSPAARAAAASPTGAKPVAKPTSAPSNPMEAQGDDPITKALNSPGDLPSLPTVLTEIQQLINDPKSSGADLRSVIEKDVAMTSSVLKLINSAFYAIPGGVSNLQRAVAFLGYDAIYQVALTVSIMKSFKVTDFPNFTLGDFWKHSLGVAAWAEEIAKAIKYPKPSDCFTAGLLHDLGKIFIAKENPDAMMKIVGTTFSQNQTFYEAELKHIPIHHTDIGDRLGIHWKLPRTIANCMKWHHEEDTKARGGVMPEDNQVIDIVMASNAFSHGDAFGNSGYPSRKEEPKAVLKRLMMKPNQIKIIQNKVTQKMQASEAFLKLL